MDQPRFELQKCLGAGGFGEVYLALEHTGGGLVREVAIKVLHEQTSASSDAVNRLIDEGQLLAMLAHPAILGVHELVRVDDRLALVTEYVAGADLAWFCVPERLLPLRVAILVTLAVAEALDFAWRSPNPTTGRPLHLIHRDVKPENVRLARGGQVKVLDFGVARSTEMERRAQTASGQVILTPGYGAPETLQFGVLGPAVDVFALGVTLFAMVTGEDFYDVHDIGAQVQLASDSVAYQEHLERRLSRVEDPDVHSLLRDMMEFAHEHRPTMREVAERCDRLERRMTGPSLLQWSKTAAFPEVAAKVGRLDGAWVDHEGKVHFPEGPPEADPHERDAPTWIMPVEEPSAGATLAPDEEVEEPDEEVEEPAEEVEEAADVEPEVPVPSIHDAPTVLAPEEFEEDSAPEPPARPEPESSVVPDEPPLTPSTPPRPAPDLSQPPAQDAAAPVVGVMMIVSGVVLFLLGLLLIGGALWWY